MWGVGSLDQIMTLDFHLKRGLCGDFSMENVWS